MTNKEKCVQALHSYIDTLDDDGIYDFIVDQNITGPNTYGCEQCSKEYSESYDTLNCCEAGLCKERFMKWLKADNS